MNRKIIYDDHIRTWSSACRENFLYHRNNRVNVIRPKLVSFWAQWKTKIENEIGKGFQSNEISSEKRLEKRKNRNKRLTYIEDEFILLLASHDTFKQGYITKKEWDECLENAHKFCIEYITKKRK